LEFCRVNGSLRSLASCKTGKIIQFFWRAVDPESRCSARRRETQEFCKVLVEGKNPGERRFQEFKRSRGQVSRFCRSEGKVPRVLGR
jgi:hypothetical protein